jgi:hypothetical protein
VFFLLLLFPSCFATEGNPLIYIVFFVFICRLYKCTPSLAPSLSLSQNSQVLLKLCRMLKQIYDLPHTFLVQLEATEALLMRTKATGRYTLHSL